MILIIGWAIPALKSAMFQKLARGGGHLTESIFGGGGSGDGWVPSTRSVDYDGIVEQFHFTVLPWLVGVRYPNFCSVCRPICSQLGTEELMHNNELHPRGKLKLKVLHFLRRLPDNKKLTAGEQTLPAINATDTDRFPQIAYSNNFFKPPSCFIRQRDKFHQLKRKSRFFSELQSTDWKLIPKCTFTLI
ncbi:hypothetical protein GEV33_008670 [Tenebrio molitor]|uniref:Uncharacterized protein n=1 Tax=Tenebrio molitor TaxID=7067 RepID=A0A8J6HHA6_TENMO|nr:hypothetical protein GEV33_008670 [Tenebrio molitor]